MLFFQHINVFLHRFANETGPVKVLLFCDGINAVDDMVIHANLYCFVLHFNFNKHHMYGLVNTIDNGQAHITTKLIFITLLLGQ